MIFEILALIIAIPFGFWISWAARDELIQGRQWFIVLGVICLICIGLFFFLGRLPELLTSSFILIVSIISYKKSFDKSWTKRKFS